MWTYRQSSGELSDTEGKVCATGYSGNGPDKNNPASQDKQNHGPIPQGMYSIEAPRDSEAHGPFVLPLEPHSTNEMFGRSGFLIHGDSITHPGEASQGCIILPRIARELIWESLDRALLVIA